MGKLFARLCLALVLVPLSVWAAPYQEGVHYQQVKAPQPTELAEKVRVEAFFSYGCPHCYKFEPVLEAWAKTQPEDVAFESVPALFGGQWNIYGQMFYALQQMEQEEHVRMAIFEAVAQRTRLSDEETISAFLSPLGIDAAQFGEAYNSFDVRREMQLSSKRAREYGNTYVPLVVVNGKYVTSPSMVAKAGLDPNEVTKVMEFLIEQER